MIRDTRPDYPPEYDEEGDIEHCANCDQDLPENPEEGTSQFNGFCSRECEATNLLEWVETIKEAYTQRTMNPLPTEAIMLINDLCTFIKEGIQAERRSTDADGKRFDRRTEVREKP